MSFDQAKTVEETLNKIIGKILHDDTLGISHESTFKDLGADSLDVVKTVVALEEAFKIEMVDEELRKIVNMGGLIEYVSLKLAAKK